MHEVTGKVAFITGGASGIGLGMARVFLQHAMKVVVADIRQDHLAHAATQLQAEKQVHFIQLDVTDREAMPRAADEAERVFGRVHVLCNNAGVGAMGDVKRTTYSDWDWILGVNLGGVINGVHTFLPRMLAHGEGGHIVNTSSIGAVVPMPGGIAYITAKSAVMGLTEALRAELSGDNIGVTLLSPGPTVTNIHQVARLRPPQYQDTGFRDIEAELSERTPPPAWMDPVAVGELVLDAILTNRLFVMTHNEFKAGAQMRCKALLTGFPAGDVDDARARALGFPVANPLYAEIVASATSPGRDPSKQNTAG
jgi:NAD(P)-dependent dehydrogenase (short-subunit alcohol dehydrogenase family)